MPIIWLRKAIKFAKENLSITRKDVRVIIHAQKLILYNDEEPWVKKEYGNFHVTMGAYDWAEVCKLNGFYMLYLIRKNYNSKIIWLYRDYGLAVLRNVCGSALENLCLRKKASK